MRYYFIHLFVVVPLLAHTLTSSLYVTLCLWTRIWNETTKTGWENCGDIGMQCYAKPISEACWPMLHSTTPSIWGKSNLLQLWQDNQKKTRVKINHFRRRWPNWSTCSRERMNRHVGGERSQYWSPDWHRLALYRFLRHASVEEWSPIVFIVSLRGHRQGSQAQFRVSQGGCRRMPHTRCY